MLSQFSFRKWTMALVICFILFAMFPLCGWTGNGEREKDEKHVNDPRSCPYSPENPLDINRASRDELMLLPLEVKDIETILFHRKYISFFTSVYEIRKLPGFDSEKFERIKRSYSLNFPRKRMRCLNGWMLFTIKYRAGQHLKARMKPWLTSGSTLRRLRLM